VTYVLISLPGDEASREADELAEWFATRRAPAARFRDEAPDHDAIRAAVVKSPVAILFGHDGDGAIRARSKGSAWADARRLGAMFKGARVYAFACNTMGGHSDDDLPALGHDAVKAGVQLFVGHATAVPAGTGHDPRGRYEMEVRRAIGAVLLRFLDGESDERRLRLAAERSFNIVHKRSPHLAGAPLSIRGAMQGLRVVARS